MTDHTPATVVGKVESTKEKHMNRWDNDTQFQDSVITSVDGTPGNYWITKDDGFTLGCPSDFTPNVGDNVRTFGQGIGKVVRGLIVAGREVWYRTQEEQDETDRLWREEYDRKQALVPKRPEVSAFGRTFSRDMQEISGFGGGYEKCCRAMVLAGVEFLSKWSGEMPVVNEFKDIIGVSIPANETAKQLEQAMLDATFEHGGKQRRAGDDCSGAMVQFSTRHARVAHAKGWDVYVAEMSKWQAEAEAAPGDATGSA